MVWIFSSLKLKKKKTLPLVASMLVSPFSIRLTCVSKAANPFIKSSVTIFGLNTFWIQKYSMNCLTVYRLLTTLNKRPLENTVRKGENAGNQHFLLFPQCFLPDRRQKS